MQSKTKLVIIHNLISPHPTPLFKELSRKYNLTVFYCAEREKNRIWEEQPKGLNYKILPSFSIRFWGKDLFTYFINLTIISELERLKPDVVVCAGWDIFAYQAAFIYCKLKGINFILWSGSTKYEKSWRRSISLPLVKTIVKGSDAYVAYGTRAKEYLVSLGANPQKIFISFNTTNLEKYQRLSGGFRKNKLKIRKQIGVINDRVVLFYGQLIERKGVGELLRAFKKVSFFVPHARLLVVGSGRQKEAYLKLAKSIGLGRITFLEDPGDEKVCKYYAIADILVAPSLEEVWGLVVNQAMASGLPVIVSKKCGSSADLVKDKWNGLIVNPKNRNELSSSIIRLLKSPGLRKTFAYRSRSLLKNFRPEVTVRGFNSAINASLKRTPLSRGSG